MCLGYFAMVLVLFPGTETPGPVPCGFALTLKVGVHWQTSQKLFQVSSVALCVCLCACRTVGGLKLKYWNFPGHANLHIHVKIMYVPVSSPFDVLSHSHSTDGLGHSIKPANEDSWPMHASLCLCGYVCVYTGAGGDWGGGTWMRLLCFTIVESCYSGCVVHPHIRRYVLCSE